MKTRYFIIYLLVLSQILSCKNDEGSKDFLFALPTVRAAPENTKFIVIPGSGCTGCISEQEEFAKKHLDSDSVYFIFTRIRSMKVFKQKFPMFLTAKNIYLDTSNQYTFPEGSEEIYPLTYQKIDGSLKLEKK
jgi:hypothetical protein